MSFDLEKWHAEWQRSPEYRRFRRRAIVRVAIPALATCLAVGAVGMALGIWGGIWGAVLPLIQVGAAYAVARVGMRSIDRADRALAARSKEG